MKKTSIIDMADVCEEAHRLTELDCKRGKIKFENTKMTKAHVEITYTEKAQVIFDKHYDFLTAKYNI